MSSTKKIREKLDLTQQELATFLGVTRSHLAQAEINRRALPTAALLKLATLENSLRNNIHYKQPHLQTQAGKDMAAMRRHAKACTHKARMAKLKLEELEHTYQCCVQTLMCVDYLQNNLPQGKDSRKDQLWIDMILAQTIKKLNRCGPAAQVKIKLTVQALEMQAAQAEVMKF